jgi:hypothetical protein
MGVCYNKDIQEKPLSYNTYNINNKFNLSCSPYPHENYTNLEILPNSLNNNKLLEDDDNPYFYYYSSESDSETEIDRRKRLIKNDFKNNIKKIKLPYKKILIKARSLFNNITTNNFKPITLLQILKDINKYPQINI